MLGAQEVHVKNAYAPGRSLLTASTLASATHTTAQAQHGNTPRVMLRNVSSTRNEWGYPMNSVRLPCIEPCFKRARRHTSFFVFYTSFCNRSWHHHLPASLSMKMRITTKAVISPNHCNQGWAATSAREMRAAGFTTNILDSRSNSGGETAGAL